MNRILEQIRPKLQRLYSKMQRNWKPKLITLGLAIFVWLVVNYSNSDNEEWAYDDIKVSIPDSQHP